MIGILLASTAALATSPATLILLIVDVALLSLRAVAAIVGISLSKPVSRLLSTATTALVILFFLLVVVRFAALD